MPHLRFKHILLIIVSFFVLSISLSLLANTQHDNEAIKKLMALEMASGGRLGVAAINTANNRYLMYHAQQQFPLCSTNKIMGVATILKQSMTKPQLLQQRISYSKNALVAYSPVTEKHFTSGMTITELCAAAITKSDNSAINLLMKKAGGLTVVNAFARSIGDQAFRLDRWEPELNSAIPHDPRDTTTPAAMAKSLQRLLLGNSLAPSQRYKLQTWLTQNTTGNQRIRAGVPTNWRVGDKTGTGDYGTTNDVGIIWPPQRAPIIIAIYFTQYKKEATAQEAIIASATRIIIDAIKQTKL